MAMVSMKERLGVYGLAEKAGALVDLHLQGGEQKVVTKDSPEFNAHVTALHPTSAKDLRTWLGGGFASAFRSPAAPARGKGKAPLSDAAKSLPIGTASPMSFSNMSSAASAMPVPFDAAFHADMYAVTRKYVLDPTSVTNAAIEGSIDRWLATLSPTIWGVAFNDIYVSANSSLTFAADVSILFAHYVTVESEGQIFTKSGLFKFDLAGFKGGVPPHERKAPPISAKTVRKRGVA
jgi:hypothetical protein